MGSEFCEYASTALSKCGDKGKESKISKAITKTTDAIDKVAPWLGPIGLGLKIATSFVGLFVEDGMDEKALGEENLRLNTKILKQISVVLEGLKDLKQYMEHGQYIKKFLANYGSKTFPLNQAQFHSI